MGVEVVHRQDDFLGLGVMEAYQLLYAMRPVDLRPPLGDVYVWRQPAKGSEIMKRLAVPPRLCS